MRVGTLITALLGGALGWSAQPHFHVQQQRRRDVAMALMAAPITRESPAPPGPDPYKLVRDDIELIKTSIKRMLTANKGTGASLAQNEVLTMAAREFTARQGKSFRPMIVLLVGALAARPHTRSLPWCPCRRPLGPPPSSCGRAPTRAARLLPGRATNPDFVISKRHFKLAVIAEMIHTVRHARLARRLWVVRAAQLGSCPPLGEAVSEGAPEAPVRCRGGCSCG